MIETFWRQDHGLGLRGLLRSFATAPYTGNGAPKIADDRRRGFDYGFCTCHRATRLEGLQGNRSGQWSVRINAQWRICFHFTHSMALNVQIVDYH
jgi:RelE-like toxin of type II toxin-antitoxin system HigB